MTDIAKQLQEYFAADGREGFEAWATNIKHYSIHRSNGNLYPKGAYVNDGAAVSWEVWQAAKASDRALIVALLEMIERQAEALDFSITEICATGLKAFKESAPIIEIAKKWREKV